MLDDVPVKDLPLFWRGRAQALRLLDKRSSNEPARIEADTYEECAKELSEALARWPLAAGSAHGQ